MNYELITDLGGKVGNLPDFRSEALYPVFEAVVNSIHAIWALGNSEDGRVVVRVQRQPELISDGTGGAIIAFEIEDSGVGFNAANMKSFRTADSTYKKHLGCKGIGRFLWLKAFDRVEIDSVYAGEDEQYYNRTIYFSLGGGINPGLEEPTADTQRTIVKLLGFKPSYASLPTAYRTTSKIAQRILEHCLSYYITDKAPEIVVKDDDGEYKLGLMYAEIGDHIETESIQLKGVDFAIHHIRLYSTHEKMHNLVLCGNGRDVECANISKALGVTGQFDGNGRKFVYTVYVAGDYLDANVDSSRMSFHIPDDGASVFAEYPVSLSELRDAVVARSKVFLAPYLEEVDKAKTEKLEKFTYENPSYRAVVKYCPEVKEEFDPSTPDDKMSELLAKHKGIAEYKLKLASSKLLKSQAQSVDEIKAAYEAISEKIEDFSRDNLASHMVFRKMIIDLLARKLESNSDGKYPDEAVIHDIIFPRKATSSTVNYDDHNLWLVDERLTFHRFAASDLELRQTTDSLDIDRPDILLFHETDDDGIATTVSLIELKKAQRKDYKESIVEQLLRIVRKLENRQIKTPSGRPIQTSPATRYYCYGICDITKVVEDDALGRNFIEMRDHRGYYGYVGRFNAYIELLAFDTLVADARRRHKLYFETLGI